MDGVTDAPFRWMVATHSRPSLIMTEFTNVEGLAHGAVKMLHAFLYDEIERPIVAQIYGATPGDFYKVAVLMAALGFDGVDINMGCPANKVARLGSGAALIRTPELAKTIVRECQRGVKDWAEGISLEKAAVHPDIIAVAQETMGAGIFKRRLIPVSVKTRIGYDSVVAEEWTNHLLEVEPANITMHGRTLKQLYTGQADWTVLARAAALTRHVRTTFLGNGDVESMEDARHKIEEYGVDGVLVGRAVLGNPWFFRTQQDSPDDAVITPRVRLTAALEHAKLRETRYPNLPFLPIRKHLLWYCKDFPGAKELRMELCSVENAWEVEQKLSKFLKEY